MVILKWKRTRCKYWHSAVSWAYVDYRLKLNEYHDTNKDELHLRSELRDEWKDKMY